MAVDDENLEIIIRSLRAFVAGRIYDAQRAEQIAQGFQKIVLKPDGSLPDDADTGEVMTQERRDEVYDKCLPIYKELLGIAPTRVSKSLNSAYDID